MSLVSVIVPVFNGEATIAAAIDSALAQAFEDFEVIVVDDGSTDSTSEILGCYDHRIRVIRQKNRGPAAARNAAAKLATGEYFAFLDADDTWSVEKLQRTHDALECNNRAVLAFSAYRRVLRDGTEIASQIYQGAPSLQDMLACRLDMTPSAVLMRRHVFERCGGFIEALGGAFEDIYLWLRVREHGPFAYVNELLATYSVRLTYCEDKWFVNLKKFESLVLERYGRDARRIVSQTRDDLAQMAVEEAVAQIANNPATALRWSIQATRIRPWLVFRRAFTLRVFRNLYRIVTTFC